MMPAFSKLVTESGQPPVLSGQRGGVILAPLVDVYSRRHIRGRSWVACRTGDFREHG